MTTPQKRPLLTAESTFGFSERINHETRPDRGRNTHTDPKTPKFCGPSRQSAGRWLREAGTIPRRLVTEAKRTGSRAISRCVRAIVPCALQRDQYRGDGLKPFWKASRRLFSSVEQRPLPIGSHRSAAGAVERTGPERLVVFSSTLPGLSFRISHPNRRYTNPRRSRAVSIVTSSHFWATLSQAAAIWRKIARSRSVLALSAQRKCSSAFL
jgi:hypothetical protein